MKILIIQTAFTGDVILATPLIEKLSVLFPGAEIDFLLRKGNEGLLENHPKLHELLTWDKRANKISNFLKLTFKVRSANYDMVVNLHRFFSSGLITFFSGAAQKRGFDKNPFSFCYTRKVAHLIGNGKHEVERNLELISDLPGTDLQRPVLYPSQLDYKAVEKFKTKPYSCIAPGSVWFTKQFPKEKWAEFIRLNTGTFFYLLGADSEIETTEWIRKESGKTEVVNLSGKLSFLESAALMKDAAMNYVNDSAPLHIASAMNAPVTAVFCSTIPAFGFGPLSDNSKIVESGELLDCRPCGLHGFRSCPKGHFRCALTIEVNELNGC